MPKIMGLPEAPRLRRLIFYLWAQSALMLVPSAALVGLTVEQFAVETLAWTWLALLVGLCLITACAQFGLTLMIMSEVEKCDLITREMLHRHRNLFSKIQMLGSHAIESAESLGDAKVRLLELIEALSKVNSLLVEWHLEGAPLREVFVQQLKLLESYTVMLDGPELMLSRNAAEVVGMAVHELATNALKYGAMRTREGRIDISWQLVGSSCELVWAESGPVLPVSQPKPKNGRGFGETVIQAMVRGLNAQLMRELTPNGFRLELKFPYPTK